MIGIQVGEHFTYNSNINKCSNVIYTSIIIIADLEYKAYGQHL